MIASLPKKQLYTNKIQATRTQVAAPFAKGRFE